METSGSCPKEVLFTDVRYISCDDLRWLSPEGSEVPLHRPPLPKIEARADLASVPRGVRLAAQRGNKTDPLPERSRAGRIIFEDGVYRSWFLDVQYPKGKDIGVSSTAVPVSVAICYRESSDAFEWEEKARSEIHVAGQSGFDGFTVFADPNGSPEERYKVVYMAIAPKAEWPALWGDYQKVHPRYRDTRLHGNYITCMYGCVSPDGLAWQPVREPLFVHKSDTDTSVYYDTWLERYVMYTRLYWQNRRWIGRVEAEDFRRWGPVQPLIWPTLDGPLSDDIYTNGRTEYPGLPGTHLMFPMIYHRYDQTSDVRLFSSADGICWNEVPGGTVLSPGAPGEWDAEFISAGKDLVPLGRDRIGIPYNGTAFPHKYPRWPEVLDSMRWAWAWWPKGRLSAVVADEEGEVSTFPLVPAGRELRLNVRTRRAGSVRVGLVGVPGRSARDCDPLCGDDLAMPVHWKGESDIGTKEGEPVALRFRLHAAELFGFEWV